MFTILYEPVPDDPGKIDQNRTRSTCRTLHLAFQGQDAGEIYDVLTVCLIRAIQKYDPDYTRKVSNVIDLVSKKVTGNVVFTSATLDPDDDLTSYLRLLARYGYLKQVMTKDKRTLLGFRRVASQWPPPKKFRNAKPIGLAYHTQNLFRMYLQRHLQQKMNEIEVRLDGMQLDGLRPRRQVWPNSDDKPDMGVPKLGGETTDRSGKTWAADTSLARAPLDVGSMNLRWVSSTTDPIRCLRI